MSGHGGRKSNVRSQRRLHLRIAAVSLHPIAGLGDDPSGAKNGVNSEVNSNSSIKGKNEVLYMCLGAAGVLFLFVFLYMYWQKRKREEQYARLLRLFEEDDELELELGLRD